AVLARAAAPVESGRWTVTAGWDDPGVRREQVRVALVPAREDEDIVERIIALMDERGEDRIPREVAAREMTGGDDEVLGGRGAAVGPGRRLAVARLVAWEFGGGAGGGGTAVRWVVALQ